MKCIRNSCVSPLQIAAAILLISCTEKENPDTRFVELSPGVTGIDFQNTLNQTEDFNIIEYLYFYNGGGVSIGDINNDGLADIYFTGNQVSNRLYLNKGNFIFEDITRQAGVSGTGNWKTGTTMADVNGDGYLDIFICGVGNYKKFDGKNQLFVNNGDLTFTERSEEYGLAFQGFSTQSAFFDYDNDGDLDMYLLNHSVHTSRSYGHARLRFQSDRYAGDKLYRNDLIPDGKPRFVEVTSVSGIYNSQVGYGLGVGVGDLNMDGHVDIYVSNDFHENDYLYINQGDGTFSEQIAASISHVSRFSMGNDIADINNDVLPDIITLDMLPRDEGVIKTTAGEESYDIYEFKLGFGYHQQFSRNTLQLNRGVDDDGHPLFSDIAALAGVEASDWSWSPLLADFDNDGWKDLFISNGILTRPNDLDYINFISTDSARRYYDYEEFIRRMPSGAVPNLFFRNDGNLRFLDVSERWTGKNASFSTGAAYADLDNDGDLDLVVNNINDRASVFRNELPGGNWLQVELSGADGNTFGIGAKVILHAGDSQLYQEQSLTRGWQSSVSSLIHFGLGEISLVDSAIVVWPSGQFQIIRNVSANQRMKIREEEASGAWDYSPRKRKQPLLKTMPSKLFIHTENQYNAFNKEKLIPHMLSTEGPDISTADVNGDGLEDFFVGGGAGQAGAVFLQQLSGEFKKMVQHALESDAACEDVASAMFDADGNGTPDLMVVGGGQEFSESHPALLPRLYLNNGTGEFRRFPDAIPPIYLNASCIATGDADGDADIDVFIGGRVVGGKYGKLPESFLLMNDGKGNFNDESHRLAVEENHFAPGMISDAAFSDLTGDGRTDLIIVGEWMPITLMIQNPDGKFQNKTLEYGLQNSNGWWNTLHADDLDADGDIDLVAGNLGLNSRLSASVAEPVKLFIGDMDGNGADDHLMTYFNDGIQHPFISRDQLVKQVPAFKRDFLRYSSFRNVKREQIIPSADSANYVQHCAYNFSSVYLENRNGSFSIKELPIEAQVFPIFSFASDDFDGDGNKDLLATGNLYSVQPEYGRYDAGYGLMMKGDGKGRFEAIPLERSGFLVRGEGRDIAKVKRPGGNIFLVARNNDSVMIFR